MQSCHGAGRGLYPCFFGCVSPLLGNRNAHIGGYPQFLTLQMSDVLFPMQQSLWDVHTGQTPMLLPFMDNGMPAEMPTFAQRLQCWLYWLYNPYPPKGAPQQWWEAGAWCRPAEWTGSWADSGTETGRAKHVSKTLKLSLGSWTSPHITTTCSSQKAFMILYFLRICFPFLCVCVSSYSIYIATFCFILF